MYLFSFLGNVILNDRSLCFTDPGVHGSSAPNSLPTVILALEPVQLV